mmetsp:Transcript_29359/g.82044  ORF Transcript_29359/g.82044 Transcript_29359/m.82044 type:complete len:259 (-) Transcript_29359:713-1489(-)
MRSIHKEDRGFVVELRKRQEREARGPGQLKDFHHHTHSPLLQNGAVLLQSHIHSYLHCKVRREPGPNADLLGLPADCRLRRRRPLCGVQHALQGVLPDEHRRREHHARARRHHQALIPPDPGQLPHRSDHGDIVRPVRPGAVEPQGWPPVGEGRGRQGRVGPVALVLQTAARAVANNVPARLAPLLAVFLLAAPMLFQRAPLQRLTQLLLPLGPDQVTPNRMRSDGAPQRVRGPSQGPVQLARGRQVLSATTEGHGEV